MEDGVSEDSVRGQFEGIVSGGNFRRLVSGEGLKGRSQRKISGKALI